MTRSEQPRINGSRSRGPVTPEGKARSSRNATKHGAYAGHSVLLKNEDRAAFNNILARRTQDFLPSNSTESVLLHEICLSEWETARNGTVEVRTLCSAINNLGQIRSMWTGSHIKNEGVWSYSRNSCFGCQTADLPGGRQPFRPLAPSGEGFSSSRQRRLRLFFLPHTRRK